MESPGTCLRALSLFVLGLATAAADAGRAGCRDSPAAASKYCALPYSLGNFQGNHRCSADVRVGRPGSKADVLAMVQRFDRVKAVGNGHSWWAESFCAGNDSGAVNIVMTELRDTLALILNPSYDVNVPPSFPIQVSEAAGTATVQAGVPQRILLDYLAAHKTPAAPLGYSVAAFSFLIDQTVGGAVATGTHGSTLQHGSLSSQVKRIELALANGTLASITPAAHPHLWRAAQGGQVSVGRLGVITELDVAIVPQRLLARTVMTEALDDFIASVEAAAAAHAAAVAVRAPAAEVLAALAPLDMTQVFWDIPGGQITRVALRPAPQAAPASIQGRDTARSGRRLRRTGARLKSLPKQALA